MSVKHLTFAIDIKVLTFFFNFRARDMCKAVVKLTLRDENNSVKKQIAHKGTGLVEP